MSRSNRTLEVILKHCTSRRDPNESEDSTVDELSHIRWHANQYRRHRWTPHLVYLQTDVAY